MNWEILRKKIYYIDGSLRDIYVKNTSMEDWEKWIDLINTKYELKFYNIHTGETESQIDKSMVFDYWNGKTDLLSNVTIHLKDILIKCYFFGGDEIENDITPSEINSIEDHNRLVDYLKDVSAYLGKEVILTPENFSEDDKKLIIVNENGIELDLQDYPNLQDCPSLNYLNQDKIKKDSTKSLSIISLAILLLLLIWNIVPIIQARIQLVNDFIPYNIIYEVAKPYIYTSSVLIFANITALILFFLKKYLPVVILGNITFCIYVVYIYLK